ncbi:hypothetical protein [Kitasatospora sp. NPDC091276]|uniref:DUF6968 family protein n=1 Tax=Kitasatospora sp. NPDC091276 TaxID=3155300 RepID=UPI00341A027C
MSAEYGLGQVIANRELAFAAPDGTQSPVLLEIGLPRRDPEGPDWYCPYRITGHPGVVDRVTAIFGVDSLQALQLALTRLPGELRELSELSESNDAAGLTFLGGTDLMLGGEGS